MTWCNVLDENGNGTVHTFAYGADGIRCQKNNIHYTCDGERILIEHNADTGRSITYLYGEKGVVGFSYRGSDYYYRKNLFGDVVAIYNTDGEEVATYEYDAWGKNLSCEDEETNEIKRINPIRYRSYYYDVETKFYYLNSRYYDPEIGRFLNADSSDYLGEGNALNNYNLFAYCENNPVMYSDPTGHAIETIWDVISLLDSLKQVLAMPSNPWARAELLGDVIDVALPGIGGLGESVGAARTICRVVDSGDDIIDSARTLRRMADKADDIKDATGSYVILYESGQHYIGKGGFLRATISAKNHLLKTDKVSAIIWAPVSSEKSAFVLEYLMQSTLNSKQKINKFAFNKYWSPGKKMLKALQL